MAIRAVIRHLDRCSSGAVIVAAEDKKGKAMAKITGGTPGRIIDFGVKDSMNMGPAWHRRPVIPFVSI